MMHVALDVSELNCLREQVNGSASSQNSKLINDILKDELGFQGLVGEAPVP